MNFEKILHLDYHNELMVNRNSIILAIMSINKTNKSRNGNIYFMKFDIIIYVKLLSFCNNYKLH